MTSDSITDFVLTLILTLFLGMVPTAIIQSSNYDAGVAAGATYIDHQYQSLLVKKGYAQYNPITGAWEWK